jgi:hypothetical protein
MTFAIHADGFVYDVDVFAFRYGVDRAFRFARAAIDALFIDPMWHDFLLAFL